MQKLKWNKTYKGLCNYSHCLVKLKNGYDIAWIGEKGWENHEGDRYKDKDVLGWIFEELVPEDLLKELLS